MKVGQTGLLKSNRRARPYFYVPQAAFAPNAISIAITAYVRTILSRETQNVVTQPKRKEREVKILTNALICGIIYTV